MKKAMIIFVCMIILSGLSGCDKNDEQMKNITEDQLTELQGEVLDFIIKDNTFGVNGCYSKYDDMRLI